MDAHWAYQLQMEWDSVLVVQDHEDPLGLVA
jgi:hypothetical protein